MTDATPLAPPRPERAERRRLALDVLAVLALAVLPDVVRAMLGVAEGRDFREPMPGFAGLWLLVRAAQVSLPLWLLVRRSGEPLSRVGFARTNPFVTLVAGVSLWIAWYVVLYFTWPLLPGADEARAAGGGPAVRLPLKDPLLGTLTAAGVLANAFAEEFAMRGVLIDRLERLTGSRVVAVVASAVAFASYHLYQGRLAVSALFLFGVLLGAAFVWKRRLAPLVIAHVVSDLPALL